MTYQRQSQIPVGCRPLVDRRVLKGKLRLTKTEVWTNYWHLNMCKTKLLFTRYRHSLCKHEREMLSKIVDAWGD